MKHTLFVIYAFFLLLNPAVGQNKKAVKFSKTITEKDLKSYLGILASDSLKGRETAHEGQKMAAEYIKKHFKSIGLNPPMEGSSYFQKYPITKVTYGDTYFRKSDSVMRNFENFLFYTLSETKGEEHIEVVFLGDTPVDSVKMMDLEGKYLAVTNPAVSNQVEELGVEGLILIIDNALKFDYMIQRYGSDRTGSKILREEEKITESKLIIANPTLISWIFETSYDDLIASGKGTSAKIVFMADLLIEEMMVENVLGLLEGSENPNEVLIISAHYDHIGITDGLINNGADDNGSGTSAVLEIAEAFSIAAEKGFRPKRNILFIAFSGEEKGLLGSKYYSDNPVIPLENTVANLNIDMVGRIDQPHADNSDYVYLIGSDRLSKDLHKLSEKVNKTYANLELDYTFNDEHDPNRFYYRSDHYNFARNNIPIIFYFNGTHEDYHQPTDTIDKIEFTALKKRAQLVFFTAWEIVNREKRIALDE